MAHWKLDGDAKDYSGKNNDGTNNGATPTTDRFGRANGAMSFDGGTQYVSVGQHVSLSPSLVSLSVWINPVVVAGYADGAVIAGYSDVVHWTNGYMFYANDNKVVFGVGNGTDLLRISTAIGAGSWAHLVGVFDGNNIYLYLNGVIVANQNAVSMVYNGTNTFSIGHTFVSYFHGSIDDVRVYNRALTPADVTALYHNGGPTALRNGSLRNAKLQ